MTFAYRSPRDLLAASGADAASYLQGQCSQDLEALAPGEVAETLILSPQGKIDAYGRCHRVGPEHFVVDLAPGHGADALARLERFRLRVKVEFELIEGEMLSLWGDGHDAIVIAARRVAPDVVALDERWPGLEGTDLLGSPDDLARASSAWSDVVTWVDDDAWAARRIEAGRPAWGREINASTIAAEVGLVDSTVSFTKGCFTGQELVARLDARGSNVARRLARVVCTSSQKVSDVLGAVVMSEAGDAVGVVTSAARAPSGNGVIGLSVVARKVQPPADVTLVWEETGQRGAAPFSARLEAIA